MIMKTIDLYKVKILEMYYNRWQLAKSTGKTTDAIKSEKETFLNECKKMKISPLDFVSTILK